MLQDSTSRWLKGCNSPLLAGKGRFVDNRQQSASSGRLLAMNVNIQPVSNKIQNWARGQINRAAGYIRQVSRDLMEEPDEGEDSAAKVRERRTLVQNLDDHFFERLVSEEEYDLTGILPDKYPSRVEEVAQGNLVRGSKQLTGPFSQFSLKPARQKAEEQQKHINDLYLETLYTIVHKIGREAANEEQLVSYAKSAFQVDQRTHQTMLGKARREKPPILLLNMLLLEAKDLDAKDIDGFSDPFVMLGIIPAGRRKSGVPEESGGTNDQQQQGEVNVGGGAEGESGQQQAADGVRQHRALLQRFSGSFRRKAGTRREKMEAAFETEDGIPARIIKASSVQRKTLNPKWNEKFQFVVGDVTDRFHLDIWDHDDENRSVLDVVTTLNQVQGLKGLGRYFKEVTQSARTSSGDLVDDFLGSVTISIKDIPSKGIQQWFKLERRSEKSEVSGQILLKLWLSTREEHRLSSTEEQRNEDFIFLDDEELVDIQQHKDLVRQFALYEISHSGEPVGAFRGQLPDMAQLILHQHAIQSDLSELHQLMCHWLAYLQMIGMGVSFELLHDTFARLVARWKPMELDKDEEYVLADSLVQFSEYCRSALLKHRLRIRARGNSRRRSPSPKRSELESFGEMVRCYRLVRESPVYSQLVPTQKPFQTEILDILKESARIHFDTARENTEARAAKAGNELSAVEELILLVQVLNITLEQGAKYETLFKREVPRVDYADISYGTFDSMLHDHIVGEMMSERRDDLRAVMQVCHHQPQKQDHRDGSQLIPILLLHLALNEFDGQKPARSRKWRMEQLDWGEHFDRAIQRWLELALVKAFARVDLSLSLDTQNPIIVLNNEVRQTVSAMDTCHIIEQLLHVWERLHVQSLLLRAELTFRIARLLCKVGKHFADQIMMRRPFDGANRPMDQLNQDQIDQFSAMVNSCEQVRRNLACAERLKLDELAKLYEQKTKEKNFREQVEKQLDMCSQQIVEQIELLAGQFVRRQTAHYKKSIFHLVWSPSACPIDECLRPLIKLLDAELSLVHRSLLHRNFIRVMYAQAQLLLLLFQECVNENVGLEPTFYRRLAEAFAVLLDFFHAEGKGIAVDTFSQSADYKRFHEQISLYQMPTGRLIELYYGELIRAQDEVTDCKYGILNLRAYYNPNSELLVIDVLSAKQLIPLDSNGLSDPFVVIELLPRMHFPEQPKAKTKVVSGNLNPVFGETFEFHMSPQLPKRALVHFVIMDHDFLKSNDLAGEAFLDLSEVPGFATQQGGTGGLKQFNLVLTHPTCSRATNSAAILVALASRKDDDKDAEEFIRGLSTTY